MRFDKWLKAQENTFVTHEANYNTTLAAGQAIVEDAEQYQLELKAEKQKKAAAEDEKHRQKLREQLPAEREFLEKDPLLAKRLHENPDYEFLVRRKPKFTNTSTPTAWPRGAASFGAELQDINEEDEAGFGLFDDETGGQANVSQLSDQVRILNDCIKQLEQQKDYDAASMAGSQGNEDIRALVDVLKNNAMKTPGSAKLPTIPLMKFDGKTENWPEFYENFYSLIDSRKDLDVHQKLNYLKNCMEGRAAKAIKGFPFQPQSYEDILVRLKQKFGNKRLLLSTIIRQTLFVPQATQKHEAREMVDFLWSQARQLEAQQVDLFRSHGQFAPALHLPIKIAETFI